MDQRQPDQSSSVKLDKRLAGAHSHPILHESEPGDLWYDDESDSVDKLTEASDMDREWQRRHNQFHTIGYRDGLIAGKEAAAQEGFNIGFKDSVFTGYKWGLVRGISSAMAFLPDSLKAKLVEIEESRNKFQQLHESVQSLSTTDSLKLFYEEQNRKSSNQEEISDMDVLENHHRQLQTLLSESPLLKEAHSKDSSILYGF